MSEKWELCYVRPPVASGAEVVFFHPNREKNKVFRNLKDFLVTKEIKVSSARHQEMEVICVLLADGWEPLTVGGGLGNYSHGEAPDLGATGYAFRKKMAQ